MCESCLSEGRAKGRWGSAWHHTKEARRCHQTQSPEGDWLVALFAHSADEPAELPEATIGQVTRVNHSFEAVASRPTREGTLQVELGAQRFSVVPTLAWDTSSEGECSPKKQFLWATPASAFSIRGIY